MLNVNIQVSWEVADLLRRYAQSEGLEGHEDEGGIFDDALKMLLSPEDIENAIHDRKQGDDDNVEGVLSPEERCACCLNGTNNRLCTRCWEKCEREVDYSGKAVHHHIAERS